MNHLLKKKLVKNKVPSLFKLAALPLTILAMSSCDKSDPVVEADPTQTSTSTASITNTLTQTDSSTGTNTDSNTGTDTITASITNTLTQTDSSTGTNTDSNTDTDTITVPITDTLTQTDSSTGTNTDSNTETDTDTITVSITDTLTQTDSGTGTNTDSNTDTDTITEQTNIAPMAVIDADVTTGVAPFDIFFESKSTDDAAGMTFSWMLIDANNIQTEISTEESFTYNLDQVGTFDVELTVTDAGGKTDNAAVSIVSGENIDNAPVASVRVIGSLTGEQSVDVNLDASASQDDKGVITFQWFVDGLESDNTTNSFIETMTGIGSYEVMLVVTDSKGQTDQITNTVTVNAVRLNGAPTADVSGTGPIVGKVSTTVLFRSSSSTDDDGIASIAWDFGDGNVSSEANPQHQYASAGTYTAILTVTDTDGIQDTESVDITMLDEVGMGEAPIAHINVSEIRGTIPFTVTFDASGTMTASNIVSYEWDFGSGAFKYGQNVEHTFTDALENTVYLTVTDDQGLSHETYVEITSLLAVPIGTPGVDMQTDGNPFLDSAFYVSPDIRVLQNESLELIDPVAEEKLYNDIRFVQQMPSAVWLDRTVAIYGGEVNDGRRPLSKFIAGDGNVLEGHLDEAVAQQALLAVDGVKPPMTAVIIVYNLPDRDCAALASNGQLNETKDGPDADSLPDGTGLERYRTEYIDVIKEAFALYPDIRIVAMLEPDGYPNMITNVDPFITATDDCNAVNEAGVYKEGLQYAINAFHDMPNVYTYIDIGHSGWLGWDSTNDDNLQRSVVGFADLVSGATESGDLGAIRGFASNTSGYTPLREPFISSAHADRQNLQQYYEWNRHVDELSFIDTMYKRFTSGDQAIGDGETVRNIAGQGFPDNLGFIIDTARNGWGGPNRPTGEGAPATKDDYEFRVDRRIHRGHWCNVNNAGIGEIPQAQPDPTRPYLDAYYWMKPPGESDGISSLTDGANDEGKSYDPMCGGESSNSTGIEADVIQGAPHAGHWFHDQFIMLINNAYPTLGVKEPQGGSDAAAFVDNFNGYTTGAAPGGVWTADTTAGAAISVNDAEYYGLTGKSVNFTAVEEDRNNDSLAMIMVEEAELAGATGDQYGRLRIKSSATGDAPETYWSMINFHGAKPEFQWHNMFWSFGGYEGNFAAKVEIGNGGPTCLMASSTPIPQDQWSCVEWNFDTANNEFNIWLDGELVEDLQINADSAGCTSRSWIAPDAITALEIGVGRYRPDHSIQVPQDAPEPEPKPDVTINIDDLAVGGSRLGCNNVRVQ